MRQFASEDGRQARRRFEPESTPKRKKGNPRASGDPVLDNLFGVYCIPAYAGISRRRSLASTLLAELAPLP
jgi:hypothetical protein